MAKLVEMTHYLECLKTDKGIIFGIQRLLQSIKKKKKLQTQQENGKRVPMGNQKGSSMMKKS